MTTTMPGSRTLRDGARVYWWIELALVATIAAIAVLVAPRFVPHGAPPGALSHGVLIVDAERFLGIFGEHAIQRWTLTIPALTIASNWWYGCMHFVVTAAVFVWLFRYRSDDFPLWRTTLAIASLMSVIVQGLWPATPPRLLAGAGATPRFVDSLVRLSSAWSFPGQGSGGIANQYAAMPSMHCVWALWCACVVVPRVRRRWIRAVAIVYPMVTLAVVVVTGNHYLLDAAGGFAVLGVGYLLARALVRTGRRPVSDRVSDPTPGPEHRPLVSVA